MVRTPDVMARRLALSPVEFSVLVGAGHLVAPPGFDVRTLTAEETAAGVATLRTRGVCVPGDGATIQLVEAVAANVAVLAAATVTIQVEVSVRERGLRAVVAVAGSLGASLFTLADGAVELSLFPALGLGAELIRAVPAAERSEAVESRIAAALGGDGTDVRVTGRLPLAALESVTEYVAPASTPVPLTDAQQALAAQVNRRTTGLMSCLVTGRIRGDLAVGQVVWLATDSGWLGLRPDPDPDGTRMVVITPVDRADIGAWVAEYVAEIVEAATP
ncbi:ESX secretion-associated protein EspG [Krasilnikovia sp. M28-CT-15]|uniref:ESX secretion-associated protein EspG n=1 Tax=Krasilnikovia sp. M28-CT-15 TaxID=3373540 RepID=UPI00399CE48D